MRQAGDHGTGYSMKLFLGVDGGQTATKVVLGDERGGILAQATGGPSNHTEEPGGPERLEQVLRSTVQQALQTLHIASLEECELAAACLGMTGEIEIKTRIIKPLFPTAHLSVVHDSVNALEGATAGQAGLIVIAGTGSVARGRDTEGREVRVGGWGHQFGDEGSAYWIGREAVRAVAAEHDGIGLKTILTPMLFDRLSVSSASELMAKYYSGDFSRDHLAGLAAWVNEAAESGDTVAAEMLRKAGIDLAKFAVAIISLLFSPQAGSEGRAADITGFLVCFTGGVFRSKYVLSSFENHVLAEFPEVDIRPALLPPVFGSLLLAYRAGGLRIPTDVTRRWSSRDSDHAL
jgi:N-acetylglucosamine kinase-like BadF-type ATPase